MMDVLIMLLRVSVLLFLTVQVLIVIAYLWLNALFECCIADVPFIVALFLWITVLPLQASKNDPDNDFISPRSQSQAREVDNHCSLLFLQLQHAIH